MNYLQSIGQNTLNALMSFGRAFLMLAGAILAIPQSKNIRLTVQQIYVVGVQSLLIIIVSGLFIGMVMALQGYTILVNYGAEGSLGPMVALSLLRELGPVVTALLFAGRAGSALTAEIGLMKATEQLSSLEMMAVDPLRRIIAPRFWAGVIAMPMLALIFSAIGIWVDTLSVLTGLGWTPVLIGRSCKPQLNGIKMSSMA